MDSNEPNIKKENQKLITKLNHSYQYIEQLTYFNALTKLPNRKKLIESFNLTLEQAESHEKAIF